jgi:hypothetical protein
MKARGCLHMRRTRSQNRQVCTHAHGCFSLIFILVHKITWTPLTNCFPNVVHALHFFRFFGSLATLKKGCVFLSL